MTKEVYVYEFVNIVIIGIMKRLSVRHKENAKTIQRASIMN